MEAEKKSGEIVKFDFRRPCIWKASSTSITDVPDPGLEDFVQPFLAVALAIGRTNQGFEACIHGIQAGLEAIGAIAPFVHQLFAEADAVAHILPDGQT